MISPAGDRHHASPVRLTLSPELGHAVDGAWWPRSDSVSRELPDLVAALAGRLGAITGIKVNWRSSESLPDFSLLSWEGKRQHVITITGRDAGANILIVPDRTSTALAVMLLRRAAGLPIDPAHVDTQACRTADCIIQAATSQSARGAAHES